MFRILQAMSVAIAELATLGVVATTSSASWLCGVSLFLVGRSLWTAADRSADLITDIPAVNLEDSE